MRLFERFWSAGRAADGGSVSEARTAGEEALRLIDDGNAVEKEGRIEEAMQRYEAAIRLAPKLARAHLNRGNVLLEMGDTAGALDAYATALAEDPDYAGAHYNMGNAYLRSGCHEAALAAYRAAIALKPDFADAEVAMGSVLQDLGQLDQAVASYCRALQINPNHGEVHHNLGNALQGLGQLDAAVASYRRALAIKPDFAVACWNLANALQDLGQLDAAVASYRRAVEIKPDFAEAYNNLGNALRELGQPDAAAESYRRALELKPDFAEAHNNLGSALKNLGQIDAAVASYRLALKINPDFAEAHYNLGNSLKEILQPDDAVASYRRALEINPDFAAAHCNLGNALLDLGQFDAALASYRRVLEIKPGFADAHDSLLFCLSHTEATNSQALFAEHCRFGDELETPLRASWPQHRNVRDPARCLQVGFVSGDLRDHPVAYFIEPVLAHLAGKPDLSLHAYYNHATEDSTTLRLRGYVKHWYPIARLSDAALAQKIGAEGIDILIDLSGHTAENRLLTFARKPAPVQASWMGYPGTTGLRAMDYYLADHYFLPQNMFDGLFTEKLVYLPASAPFLPDETAPLVNALPALSKGYLTFASFNRLSKVGSSVIALWSQLLRALPSARMLLGGMPRDGQYNALIDRFAREGIVRERLSFFPRCKMSTYLALHHQVDMCLDTFPYTGGTTTSHALWMGVPTLTLAGHTVPGRQGAAILGHVGLPGFVASDAADFQAKGIAWAGDPAALATIRAGLRERCEQSLIRRPEVIASGLEHALRTMWQRWCAGLPAESFDASRESTHRGLNDR